MTCSLFKIYIALNNDDMCNNLKVEQFVFSKNKLLHIKVWASNALPGSPRVSEQTRFDYHNKIHLEVQVS